jgi:hypothetical protein
MLQEIFSIFCDSVGQFTNLGNCIATLLNCSNEKSHLSKMPSRARSIASQVATSASLSVHRLTKCEEQPLNDAVSNRILGWKGSRTTMAAVTLPAVLVHLYIRGQLTPLTREDGHSCGHARILLEVDSVMGSRMPTKRVGGALAC